MNATSHQPYLSNWSYSRRQQFIRCNVSVWLTKAQMLRELFRQVVMEELFSPLSPWLSHTRRLQ